MELTGDEKILEEKCRVRFFISFFLFANTFLFQSGFTPIMYAVIEGYQDVLEVLISAGANLDTRNEVSMLLK